MSPCYDVFLSHATADKPAVEYLAHKLRAVGIEPFLDKWSLRPGRVWQTELAKGFRESGACAIFFGSEEFGPWHQQEMLVALDRGARDLEFPVLPFSFQVSKSRRGFRSFSLSGPGLNSPVSKTRMLSAAWSGGFGKNLSNWERSRRSRLAVLHFGAWHRYRNRDSSTAGNTT